MKKRRVKFVWGASRVIKGRWFLGLFGIYDREEGHREDGLALSVRGLTIWGGALAGVLYVAATLALFWFWQRNPYSALTYEDALWYPFRRSQLEEKKGQALIAQGQDLFRARKWYDAAKLLRLGLDRYPRDFRARLTLAQFYLITNQRPLAVKVVQDGLRDEYPGRGYLEAFFKIAADGEDHDLIARTSLRYMPRLRGAGPATEYRWLLGRAFNALLAAGRGADALALAESAEKGDVANEYRVLALLAVGRMEEALTFLAEWRAQAEGKLSVVLPLQVRALREAKKYQEMEHALAELRALRPSDPAPVVFAVVQQAMAGREREAGAAFDDFLFRFGGTEANLVLLSRPLAEIGNLELLQRCTAAAAEQGFSRMRYQALLAPILVKRGEWDAAAETLAALAADPKRDAVTAEPWRLWMERLVDCCRFPTEPTRVELVNFLRGFSWPARVIRQSIEALVLAGRLEVAREVIGVGVRSFPADSWLQTQGEAVAAQLAARAPAAMAETAEPTKAVSERVFVQRLESLVQAAQWNDAEQYILQIQSVRPAPAWLGGRDGLIRMAQLQIGYAQRDLPGMITVARIYLNGEVARSRQLLDFARGYFAEGEKSFAVGLAREIVRRTPNFAEAHKSLEEWSASLPPGMAGAVQVPLPVPALPAGKKAGMGGGDSAAELAEVRKRQRNHDQPGMVAAARLFLNGDRVRSQQILELAREFFAEEDKSAASGLAREVLRKTPGFPPARRLLNEWGEAEK